MTRLFTILSIAIFTISLFSCKPAAEDRNKMHENAKRVSDSIAIDGPLNEVMPKPAAPVADTSKK